jgi:hypothetical protein
LEKGSRSGGGDDGGRKEAKEEILDKTLSRAVNQQFYQLFIA